MLLSRDSFTQLIFQFILEKKIHQESKSLRKTARSTHWLQVSSMLFYFPVKAFSTLAGVRTVNCNQRTGKTHELRNATPFSVVTESWMFNLLVLYLLRCRQQLSNSNTANVNAAQWDARTISMQKWKVHIQNSKYFHLVPLVHALPMSFHEADLLVSFKCLVSLW